MEDHLCEDDGLFTPEVGSWAVTKHAKIGYYSSLFSSSMKKRWDYRIYIDLFAGAGKSRVEKTGNIIPGSPLLSLNVEDPYDQYIFCEESIDSFSALKQRIDSLFPEKKTSLINGDCNYVIDQILSFIPAFSSSFTGLTLCFVDPYKMSNLKFSTIAKIAEKFVDFLVLIPSYMDINRNEQNYIKNENKALDEYLGTDAWRPIWEKRKSQYDFGLFIAEKFCMQMRQLGYIYEGLEDLELVRMENNVPLYHLAFFSRNPLGLKFWRETQKNTNPQLSFL